MRLTGIITQGASRLGTSEYVKNFKVASSLDGNTYAVHKVQGQWRDKVKEPAGIGSDRPRSETAFPSAHSDPSPQVFAGNTDNDGIKTNLFEPSIVARYIRVIPVICRRACTLRMELVGCELNGKETRSGSGRFLGSGGTESGIVVLCIHSDRWSPLCPT